MGDFLRYQIENMDWQEFEKLSTRLLEKEKISIIPTHPIEDEGYDGYIWNEQNEPVVVAQYTTRKDPKDKLADDISNVKESIGKETVDRFIFISNREFVSGSDYNIPDVWDATLWDQNKIIPLVKKYPEVRADFFELSPGRKEGDDTQVVKSADDIVQESLSELDGMLTVLDGEIQIDSTKINLYDEILVYVLAARISAVEDLRSNASVPVSEMMKNNAYEKAEIWAYLSKPNPLSSPKRTPDPTELPEINDTELEIEVSNIPEAVNKTTGEEQMLHTQADLFVGYSKKCLNNAREKINDGNSDAATFELMDSIREIRDYPIVVERDRNWKDYTRYISTAVGYLADDSFSGAEHALSRAEQTLEGIKKNIENERDRLYEE
ncbi:hypothetical protein GOC74_02975 [Halomicrobium mukohataei]|uniref:Restriction endonuclease type IV Mrr domain-containing protein n=1 Tax=Halomicrobium mukohataei TaxID=57705 RepID=A0A847U6H4_9EURY|nr:restriction endonuclease [Halomicrobium mukohataei]NLV08895.1 hypothetical protein [Halomicrobium mukohataei]